MVCESMCDKVRLDGLGPSPKGGGEVEGGSPANQRERRGTVPESTMTQQKKQRLSIYVKPRATSVHRAITNKI